MTEDFHKRLDEISLPAIADEVAKFATVGAAISQARTQAIDDCIRVARKYQYGGYVEHASQFYKGQDATAKLIAADLEALKDTAK